MMITERDKALKQGALSQCARCLRWFRLIRITARLWGLPEHQCGDEYQG